MSKHAALVLAAGKGTRMHSHKPKVLQTLIGEPMLSYVHFALRPLFENHIWTVIGHGAKQVQEAYLSEKMRYILQEEQCGTGHALHCALAELQSAGYEHVLVINGDTPLVSTHLLKNFIQAAKDTDVSFATINLPQPGSYGRVVRHNGHIVAIVEAKDYDAQLYGPEPCEVNAGIYYLRLQVLAELLPKLTCANNSGEYYITDLIALAVAAKRTVIGVQCDENTSLLGVNTPIELAQSEDILRMRIVSVALNAGIIIHGVQTVRIGPRVILEPGVEIFGPCDISGASRIATGAVLHAHTIIHDSYVEKNAHILPFSHLHGAHVGTGASVGPYGRLRPGAVLKEDARVGNFVEVKKAVLGKGAKASHLSYIGDASIGEKANIGAGTITCNYDGTHKHVTHIGKNAFIGSNTALVAPVHIGDDALIGAGSVITKDVPEGHLGIARGRQSVIPQKKKRSSD